MEVKAHYREGRRCPWEARWWVHRKMRARFFATEKERDKFIREFSREIAHHGEEVFKFDKARMRRWQEVDERLPHVDPMELAEFWLAHHPAQQAAKTVAQGCAKFLENLRAGGSTAEYRKHVETALGRFAAGYGERLIGEVTADDIAGFLQGLPFQALTRRHMRGYLASAFKWFVKQGWARANPVAAVPAPKVVLAEPGILTVPEVEALFRANETVDPEICGLLALGAFAGMRASAVARLSFEELDFKNRAILTPASKTKKGRRHYIEGLPDNLWAWLERTPKSAFSLGPRQVAFRREAALRRAGLLVTKADVKRNPALQLRCPPKNALRHSFVSYHVALHRDPGRTALLVSHRDQNVLWDHYLGVATKEAAERYFEIRPGGAGAAA